MSLSKICKHCSKAVKVYVACSECDAVYHTQCLSKISGMLITQEGSIICCSNITSKSSGETKRSSGKIITISSESRSSEYFGIKKSRESQEQIPNGQILDSFNVKEETIDDCGTEVGEELSIYYEASDIKAAQDGAVKFSGLQIGRYEKNGMKEHVLDGKHERNVKRCKEELVCLSEQENDADENRKKLKCDECNFSAKWYSQLEYHRFVHSNERQFKCSTCDGSFKRKSCLMKHIKTHDMEREKKFKCPHCNISYYDKGSLTYHTKAKHLNDRKYKCDNCSYVAVQKGSLKIHVLRVHNDKMRKYKCNICEYLTHEKAYLTNHIYTHAQEKPFACPYQNCNHKTTQQGLLKRHMLTKHSNEVKKYKCNNCEYSAHQKSNLTVHNRIHSNEKPYKCPYENCIYKCAQSGNLKTHIKHCHKLAKSFKRNKCTVTNASKLATYRSYEKDTHLRQHK